MTVKNEGLILSEGKRTQPRGENNLMIGYRWKGKVTITLREQYALFCDGRMGSEPSIRVTLLHISEKTDTLINGLMEEKTDRRVDASRK